MIEENRAQTKYNGKGPGCTILFFVVYLLIGCAAVGPDYTPPEMTLPGQWNGTSDTGLKKDPQQLAHWWRVIDDPALTGLVQRAVADNLDVKEALSRIRASRLQGRITHAAFLPTASGEVAYTKREYRPDEGPSTVSETYVAGFDAGWELDIFGGVRRSVEASEADVEATVENFHDVVVTLLAEVALSYTDIRTFQKRLTVAKSNMASQQETWELLKALSQAGRGDELALTQARYNLESTKARIPGLESSLETAMNRLAVLIGQPAGSLHDQLSDLQPLPRVSPHLVVGVPADIIRRRPDIRRAERELAAQTARIGEAEADLYPRLTLNGSIGLEAITISNILSSPASLWSFGPAFRWRIFEGNAIRNNIELQGELQQQAYLQYESTVLSALEEVENALVAYAKEQQRFERLQDAAAAARLAEKLAGYQYETGLTGFSDVLDAQRSRLSFEDQLAESAGTVLADLIRIYKALGGGWEPFDQG